MQSGVILQHKKVRFHTKKDNRNLRRASALMRLSKKKEYEYLKKVGRIKEDERGGRR